MLLNKPRYILAPLLALLLAVGIVVAGGGACIR